MIQPETNPLTRYQSDPCLFAEEVLGVRLTPYQKDILLSVRDNPRTAARTGNGVGKTRLCAVLVLWAVCCFPNTWVVTTASTNRQVEMQLWSEIQRLYRNARVPLGGELLSTELRFPKTSSRAVGFSTDDPGLFEGFHAERVLVIVDEAKSVGQPIFDAVERLLSAGKWVRLLVASTPGGACGPFHDCFGKNAHLYARFHVSAYEAPFVRRDWIEERKQEWGEESALYQSAILGDFPTCSQDGVVISLSHVQRLIENPPAPSGTDLRAGIDLAAGGRDESVVALFEGNQMIALECWHIADTMQTVGKIIELIKKHDVPCENINADSDGMGGPIIDRLWEQGYHVNRVHNGDTPVDQQRFANLASEMWVTVGQKIENREIILLPDERLIAQLTARKQKPRSDGRIQLESKEELRARGFPSPDRAEAAMYACARIPAQIAAQEKADYQRRRKAFYDTVPFAKTIQRVYPLSGSYPNPNMCGMTIYRG
jgi:hypothetical protein